MAATVAEYAREHGISEQRVRELARDKRIRAERVGRTWVISSPERRVPTRRALSTQSQDDLVAFLNTQSFAHVTSFRRSRLVARVRALAGAASPASLLRDYFGDRSPEGYGGAAIVRAAQAGLDEQVSRVLLFNEPSVLADREAVAQKLKDIRAIRNLSVEDLASQSGVDSAIVRRLELARVADLKHANLHAARLFSALHYAPAAIHTERSRGDSHAA